MTNEILKPKNIPNVNLTVVLNLLIDENKKPLAQFMLLVHDEESLKILKGLYPDFGINRYALKKILAEQKMEANEEIFLLYDRVFLVEEKFEIENAFERFKHIQGQTDQEWRIGEEKDDINKGSFLYALSNFLYFCLFNTPKGVFSLIEHIIEGNLEITFIPGFQENAEPEIVNAWKVTYDDFGSLFSPFYEHYLNAIELFDSFKSALYWKDVWYDYDEYYDHDAIYRDDHKPLHKIENIKFRKLDFRKDFAKLKPKVLDSLGIELDEKGNKIIREANDEKGND